MQVVFRCPPPGFNPSNRDSYTYLKMIRGVYVYGLKLGLIGKELFIPLYVGISNDLMARLWQHYEEENTTGNSKKEVFNLSNRSTLADLNNLYHDMSEYDQYSGVHPLRFDIPSLIWFNHRSFFDHRLGLPMGTSNYNNGHQDSVGLNGDLDILHGLFPVNGALDLKNKISRTKRLFDCNYYFIYANLTTVVQSIQNGPLFEKSNEYRSTNVWAVGKKNGQGKDIAERMEYATKVALRRIGIHTTAKANGALVPMHIDFSEIQDNLVNLTGAPFEAPLIISV
jgi:hypothetical protein